MDKSVVQSVRLISSRESGTDVLRLTVRFRVGLQLRGDGSGGVLTLAFDAETNRTYEVKSRAVLDGGT